MAPIPAPRPGLGLTPGLVCHASRGAVAFSKAKLEMCFAAIVFWQQSWGCCYIWNFEAAPPWLDSLLLICIRLPLQTSLCEFYFQPRSLGASHSPLLSCGCSASLALSSSLLFPVVGLAVGEMGDCTVVHLLGNSQVHWVKTKPALGSLLLHLLPSRFYRGPGPSLSTHNDITSLHSTLSRRTQVQSLPRGPGLHPHSAQQYLLVF